MKQGEKTRRRIVEAANDLFYQNGFAKAAMSDIVSETGLSKGNITYHFRSKGDILDAVLEHRAKLSVEGFAQWEIECHTPEECLNKYIDSLVQSKSELTRFGCRNGSLASELGKNRGMEGRIGQDIFDTALSWLSGQFELAGASATGARELALEIMIRGQGICLLSQAYNDEDLFSREVEKLRNWLDATTSYLQSGR